MKVFALGGYGKTAIPAVDLLARSDLVTTIVIAGRNMERAEKTAADLGEKVTAVQADGTNVRQIASLLADYDIVMNVAYSDTVLPTIKACCQTRTNYCDAATWGDTVKETLKLDSQTREAGITAIVATGVSPCISNLMGVHVASRLDEVEQLQIGRADVYNFQTGHELIPSQWMKDPQESLSALQEFKSFFTWTMQKLQENGSRTIRDYRNGQWAEIDPMKEGWDIPRSEGDPSNAHPYYCGDDSWGSLPHDLSSATPVEVGHSPFPPQLENLLRELALHVLEGGMNADTAVSDFYTTIGQNPQLWLTAPDDFVAPVKMWVNALGSKGGHTVKSRCWFTPPMWNVGGYFLTSVALAVSVLKILRGEVNKPGVTTAEKAFDPQSFFDDVATFLPELSGKKMIDQSFKWLE